MTRFLTSLAAFLAAAPLFAQEIDLQWVGDQPQVPAGQSWGVPFEKGQIDERQTFSLTDGNGDQLPLQQWVMARHRDGSVKWMGFAASLTPDQTDGLKLTAGPKLTPRQARQAARKASASEMQADGIKVSETADEVTVDNGVEKITFGKSGAWLVRAIEMNGTKVAENGRLVCIREDRSQEEDGILKFDDFQSRIDSVSIEKTGPVLAVVKIDGMHSDGTRDWLPFSVRFYIYDNVPSVRMVHSFIYDGDQFTDFIKGLGIEFTLPLREEIHNRHMRFAGENGGLWGEAVKPLAGRRVLTYPGIESVLRDQFEGKRVPNQAEYNAAGQKLISDWADWSDFRLTQLTPDGFDIRKRTNAESRWIGTAGGNRAPGYMQAGDVSGGLGLSLKDFWQSYPTELEIMDMTEDKATMTVWIWSPRGEVMDMRHYDTEGHDLNSAYEDYQEGMSTPYGISRTSEITIVPYSTMPTRDESVHIAQTAQNISQLMATPQYLHDAGAFGVWSLPDPDGGEVKQWIEKQIDDYIAFYEQSIETQRWYGFWNYGDDAIHGTTTSAATPGPTPSSNPTSGFGTLSCAADARTSSGSLRR